MISTGCPICSCYTIIIKVIQFTWIVKPLGNLLANCSPSNNQWTKGKLLIEKKRPTFKEHSPVHLKRWGFCINIYHSSFRLLTISTYVQYVFVRNINRVCISFYLKTWLAQYVFNASTGQVYSGQVDSGQLTLPQTGYSLFFLFISLSLSLF